MIDWWNPSLEFSLSLYNFKNWIIRYLLTCRWTVHLLTVSVPLVWWKSNEAGNPRIWNEAFWFTEAFHLMRCKEPSSVATIISSRTHKQLIKKTYLTLFIMIITCKAIHHTYFTRDINTHLLIIMLYQWVCSIKFQEYAWW